MSMTKMFRKNSRIFLLVFMSALLVVFLVGDVIGRGGGGGANVDPVLAVAFGEEVHASDFQVVQDDMEIARMLGFGQMLPAVRATDQAEAAIAMYLLTREAELAGVQASPELIVDVLSQQPGAGEVINSIRDRRKMSLEAIYASAARALTPMYYASFLASAADGSSKPRLEREFRNSNQQAQAWTSVISSEAFLEQVPEPTEEELLAFYEEAKDRDPDMTGDEPKFGYRVPDRVRVEVLTIDPNAIIEEVRISTRAAKDYYERNRTNYMKPAADPSAPRVQMTFEEAEDRVRSDYRRAKAIAETYEYLQEIEDETRRVWFQHPLEEGNVTSPTADEIVSFEALASKYDRYPVEFMRSELLSRTALGGFDSQFAGSFAMVGNRPMQTSNALFNVEGLVEYDPGMVSFLRVNEPATAQVGFGTRVTRHYLYRVVEVDPAGPPDSMDDVREEVVADYMSLKAFELAGAHAERLAEAARTLGLQEAVANAAELRDLMRSADPPLEMPGASDTPDLGGELLSKLEPTENRSLSRGSPFLTDVGSAPNVVPKIFELADASVGDGEKRVGAYPEPRTLEWVVAELVEIKPMYASQWEARRPAIEQTYVSRSRGQFQSNFWLLDNILKRADYKPIEEEEDEGA